MPDGLFVTLEGGDGAGKSTVAKMLADEFTDEGHEVVLTREPGGTIMAEEIRELVLSHRSEKVDFVTEALLMFAARKQHVENLIKPALAENKIVICDRYIDSTYVYQCVLGELPKTMYENMVDMIALVPDLTLLLHVDTHVGIARNASSDVNKSDRLDDKKLEDKLKITEAFRLLQVMNSSRIKNIDANRELQDVVTMCRAMILRAASTQ